MDALCCVWRRGCCTARARLHRRVSHATAVIYLCHPWSRAARASAPCQHMLTNQTPGQEQEGPPRGFRGDVCAAPPCSDSARGSTRAAARTPQQCGWRPASATRTRLRALSARVRRMQAARLLCRRRLAVVTPSGAACAATLAAPSPRVVLSFCAASVREPRAGPTRAATPRCGRRLLAARGGTPEKGVLARAPLRVAPRADAKPAAAGLQRDALCHAALLTAPARPSGRRFEPPARALYCRQPIRRARRGPSAQGAGRRGAQAVGDGACAPHRLARAPHRVLALRLLRAHQAGACRRMRLAAPRWRAQSGPLATVLSVVSTPVDDLHPAGARSSSQAPCSC